MFVIAVISCQQLLTADKNENQPAELKFGTSTTFRVLKKNLFDFFLNDCCQLSTTNNNWWQLMKMKINLEIYNLAHISPLGCWRKFSLNLVHNFYQLLTAVNNLWQRYQLIKMKISLECYNLAHIPPLDCKWRFHLIFFHNSCHQLSTSDENWW